MQMLPYMNVASLKTFSEIEQVSMKILKIKIQNRKISRESKIYSL